MASGVSPMASGVLPIQELRKLVREGEIYADKDFAETQFQPNSIDLRLGPVAYRTRCSFLPLGDGRNTTTQLIGQYRLYDVDLSDVRDGHVFETGKTYLIPLEESLALRDNLWGTTNPKSSSGRLDMLARVITEQGHVFDTIPHGYNGRLYLDLMTRSFPIRLRAGDCLAQLRILRGSPSTVAVPDGDLRQLIDSMNLVRDDRGRPISSKKLVVDDGILLTVRLRGKRNATIAYIAKKNTNVIDFAKRGHPPTHFWRYIGLRRSEPLMLEPEEFYIFSSNERVRIPPQMCAEMVAFDVRSGEVRTHYAGFFDSGFGMNDGGAHVVLEVRNRDMPFLVQHGQHLFRLRYFKNTDMPEELYGAGRFRSHYQGQGLKLAKQFDPIVDKPKVVSKTARPRGRQLGLKL